MLNKKMCVVYCVCERMNLLSPASVGVVRGGGDGGGDGGDRLGPLGEDDDLLVRVVGCPTGDGTSIVHHCTDSAASTTSCRLNYVLSSQPVQLDRQTRHCLRSLTTNVTLGCTNQTNHAYVELMGLS